jgi:hypothetical protein
MDGFVKGERGFAILVFIIPAITWPIDLYWTLYRKLF